MDFLTIAMNFTQILNLFKLKRMSENSILLYLDPIRSPLAPLNKGGIGIKVPLNKRGIGIKVPLNKRGIGIKVPLNKRGIGIKVPLNKGDLGGATHWKRSN
jgi:hypothetical protein